MKYNFIILEAYLIIFEANIIIFEVDNLVPLWGPHHEKLDEFLGTFEFKDNVINHDTGYRVLWHHCLLLSYKLRFFFENKVNIILKDEVKEC